MYETLFQITLLVFGDFLQYNCIEGIQNQAIRVFLGVHKFAPKLGLEGDMGWMSCNNRHCLSVLILTNRLLKLPANRLTKKIYLNNFYIVRSCHGNWCYNVLRLLYNVNLESSFYEIDIEMIQENLMNIQEENLLHSVSNKPKI